MPIHPKDISALTEILPVLGIVGKLPTHSQSTRELDMSLITITVVLGKHGKSVSSTAVF